MICVRCVRLLVGSGQASVQTKRYYSVNIRADDPRACGAHAILSPNLDHLLPDPYMQEIESRV